MDKEQLRGGSLLSDTLIQIPEAILAYTGGRSTPGISLLSCSDFCAESCPTAHEDDCTCSNQGGEEGCTCSNQNDQNPCTCSSQGGECLCSNQGGQCTCANQGGQEPPPAAGRITSTSSTSSEITIHFTGIARAVSYQVAIRMEEVSGQAITYDIGDVRSYTFTGLDPETAYVINYRGVDKYGVYGSFILPSGPTVRTKPAFTRFDWTYAGLDSDGSLVYGVEKQSMLGVYVAAWEWNDLANLVETVTGNSVSKAYSGATITASIVNSMANALGVSTVSRGDTITADFFNRLRSAYNNLG